MDELEQLKIWAGIVPQQQKPWVPSERTGGPLMSDRVPAPREAVAESEQLNEHGFGSTEEMLQFILNDLRASIKNFKEDPDQDAYYVVQDVQSLLDTIDESYVGK